MAKVAIVILNWNGQKMLAKYLPNVVEYSRQDAEIWVADNNSSDQSMLLLETQFPHVKTIVLEQNFGFAEGYNRALEQIEAEYYVLLNSDVEVAHHWLTPLIEFMDSHPQVAACQPKLLAEYDKDMFEYAGACGGFLDKFGYPFCRGRIFETVERDNGQYDYQQEVGNLMRFGMKLDMPYQMDQSHFYGLGPNENYIDRCSSQRLGIYTQTADEQFYPYIRPQETGTKTGIRWWNQTTTEGKGLKIVADAPFSASALHYNISDLDEGDKKKQRHAAQLPKSKYTELCIDKKQAGVGGVDSWSRAAEAQPEYRLKYGDYSVTFWLVPVK